jgi:hypothetical protein
MYNYPQPIIKAEPAEVYHCREILLKDKLN